MNKTESIIAYIADNPGAKNQDVQKGCDLLPSYTSAMLSQLTKRGLLSRTKNADGLWEYTADAAKSKPRPGRKPGKKAPAQAPSPATVLAAQVSSPAARRSLDDTVKQFVASLVDQIVSYVKPQVLAQLEERLAEELPKAMPQIHPPTPKPLVEKKRRVMVLGLLPQQAGLIAQEFGDVFDLTFMHASDGESRYRDKIGSMDLLIHITKFISHSHREIAVASGVPLREISGGMSQLRDVLTEEFVS